MQKRKRGETHAIILRSIWNRKDHEARWSELLEASGISTPGFAGHMRRLLRKKLITKKGEGKETRYLLTLKGLIELIRPEDSDGEEESRPIIQPTPKTFAALAEGVGRLLASSLPSIQDSEILKTFEEADEKLRAKLASLQKRAAAARQHK
jgi:DNA-binding MarR family transcriptional regulator